MKSAPLILLALCAALFTCDRAAQRIDRYAWVTRHNPVLTAPDTLGSLSVGNGEFAFTVDASGLQTFVDEYENGIPLGTHAQWGWHSEPSVNNYSLDDVAKKFASCDDRESPYAVQQTEGRAGEATSYLRANPHRLHLGTIGLAIQKRDGSMIELNDLRKLNQKLDLWTGTIETSYEIEGIPVYVKLLASQKQDGISVKVSSPLIDEQRLKILVRFPYGKTCHVCPGYDWQAEEMHSTETTTAGNTAGVVRRLDSTEYHVGLRWSQGTLHQNGKHELQLLPTAGSGSLELTALFGEAPVTVPDVNSIADDNVKRWKEFWTTTGAIDFSACTDPRAVELERRVVLSRYLTNIQCTGSLPPQETGLTMNSWYGKFHLEMHIWHAAHFALWNQPAPVRKAMQWYRSAKQKAAATATWQGYEGLRWQKMTDPEGNESPSNVGAFIIWQQPHPIYLAELLYRNSAQQDAASKEILDAYKDIVFGTADFMATFLRLRDGKYHLCHPLIPAQEIFRAAETDDPTYELQYWHFAMQIAQQWRERTGMPPNAKWRDIIENMADLPATDSLYLPNATTPDAYIKDEFRRDHPSVLAALGFVPQNERLDTTLMHHTLDNILAKWDWPSTWGWDYPMIAMTAARLYQPETAIDALLMDTQKNTYLVNGHNYQDERLRLYLPGNGGLLAAVAMMAAGWDGATETNPGFPKDGRWNVRWEDLSPAP